MKCLCCGKPITNSATNVEKEWCWHKKCVKRFFQTDELPILDITKEQLEILANEIVNEGLTVPGVQKKLSLHLSTDLNARLTIVDYPTGYILKPQTEEFDNMPEFEDLAMRLAEIMGIQTVPHALIKMNDEYAYSSFIFIRAWGTVWIPIISARRIARSSNSGILSNSSVCGFRIYPVG